MAHKIRLEAFLFVKKNFQQPLLSVKCSLNLNLTNHISISGDLDIVLTNQRPHNINYEALIAPLNSLAQKKIG